MTGTIYRHEFREHRKQRPRNVPMPSLNDKLWPEFDQYLTGRKLDPDLARFNEWYPSSDAGDGAPRVVIPCSNSLGRVYWQARLIPHIVLPGMLGIHEFKRYQSAHTDRAESVVITWPNPEFIPIARGVALFEGPTDALAASSAGWVGVALMGDKPPAECIEYVVRIFTPYNVWRVVPDRDLPKLGAQVVRALGMLGKKAKLVDVKPYKDFASVSEWERHGFLQADPY